MAGFRQAGLLFLVSISPLLHWRCTGFLVVAPATSVLAKAIHSGSLGLPTTRKTRMSRKDASISIDETLDDDVKLFHQCAARAVDLSSAHVDENGILTGEYDE